LSLQPAVGSRQKKGKQVLPPYAPDEFGKQYAVAGTLRRFGLRAVAVSEEQGTP
jgi:hypothetical protein